VIFLLARSRETHSGERETRRDDLPGLHVEMPGRRLRVLHIRRYIDGLHRVLAECEIAPLRAALDGQQRPLATHVEFAVEASGGFRHPVLERGDVELRVEIE